MHRSSCFRTAGPIFLLALALLSCTRCLLAQTGQPQPITSLPKPPGDPSATPAQAATPAPAAPADQAPASQTPSQVPASQIHPITSLPKPPGTASQPAVSPLPAQAGQPAAAQPAVAPPVAPQPPAVPAAATQTAPQPVVSAPAAQPAASAVAAPAPADVSPATPAMGSEPVVQPDLGTAPLRASTNLPLAPAPAGKRKADMRPFHSWAVQVKGGFAGFGVDVATSMTDHFNVRLGGSFFSYSGSYNADGITIDGEVKFHTGNLSLDYYPFKKMGLRISAGIVYNGNNLNASTDVPGGQEFDLGDGSYTSDPSDPVHGSASITFGHRVDPMFTLGFGNMIPRSGSHFSMPFEIGFEYTGVPPKLSYNLLGSACDNMGNCGPLSTDPTAQADEAQELSDINSDITLLRFYPIISLGVAWKF